MRLQYTQYSPPRLERRVLFDKVIIIISSFLFSVPTLHIITEHHKNIYTSDSVIFLKKGSGTCRYICIPPTLYALCDVSAEKVWLKFPAVEAIKRSS